MSDPYAPPQVESVQIQEEIAESLPYPNAPVGVKGWLLLFCIGRTILSPLLWVNQSTGYVGWFKAHWMTEPVLRNWHLLDRLVWTFLVLYGAVAGFQLWTRRRNALKSIRVYLLIRLFAVPLLALGLFLLRGSMDTQTFINLLGYERRTFIREGTYLLTWWLYFKKSKRVANTYRS